MGYLDNTGLTYFYNKLKSKFISSISVSGKTISWTKGDGTTGSGAITDTEITATGKIVHTYGANTSVPVTALKLYNSSGTVVTGKKVAITNKNLFRIDLLSSSVTNKGVKFTKNSDGSVTAVGTSTGTYAATTCNIDKNAFVVGQTYTMSTSKTSGILYIQLALTYTDNTTDYLVSSNSPATFTVTKTVKTAVASVQITASGATVNQTLWPQIELSGSASSFEKNTYTEITYNGSNLPTLPSPVSNVWSNDDTVTNISMTYETDGMAYSGAEQAKLATIDEGATKTVVDSEMLAESDNPVSNSVISTALDGKVDKVSGMGLSSNDYTTTEKNKLSGIAAGAEVNQNAFSDVVVDNQGTPTTIQASTKTDTLNIAVDNGSANNSSYGLLYFRTDPTTNKVTIGFDGDGDYWWDDSLYADSAGTAGRLTSSRAIDGVNFNGQSAITHYGTCSVAAAAKTVSLSNFTLVTGATVWVKFTATNTGAVASLTLNVNNTGAKPIKYRNANLPSVSTISANNVYQFVYDGTNWQLVGDLDTVYSVATTSANGLMSATDKADWEDFKDNYYDPDTPTLYADRAGISAPRLATVPANTSGSGFVQKSLKPTGFWMLCLSSSVSSNNASVWCGGTSSVFCMSKKTDDSLGVSVVIDGGYVRIRNYLNAQFYAFMFGDIAE